MIIDLTEEEVTRLAAESNATTTERKRCSEKLAILQAGKTELRRLHNHRAINSGKISIEYAYVISQGLSYISRPAC